ncbi:MAG: Xaa-Pro peptidase family protein [Gordonia sp. (in: high G+C Gram-positive bacteria)]|uniref:M24 family metallopeptidase n=1 Tax=Gordonia sp. (in: high G+C Gram-positive bacteria) TaxID=84139 RepID=UPI003BB54987
MPVNYETTPDFAGRRARLAAAIGALGADVLVISDLVNLRYLTGFTGSNGSALVRTDGPDLIATDGRYRAQVAAQAPGLDVLIERDTVTALVALLADHQGELPLRVGFEADAVTVAQFAGLSVLLDRAGLELVPLRGTVEKLREVKDDGEIAQIEAACRLGDKALATLIERDGIVAGRTEREVARDLEWIMYGCGADAIAFETIVAAGANSAIPHHRPTDAVLASGDFVKIDFGAVVGGYHSDMTRTFVLDQASDWQRAIYQIVADAQHAGRMALLPGAALADVDAAARDVITAAGYGEQYVHGLGHGVGLAIHEAPGIGAAATGTLRDGATVTVEPGIYLPGRGGVRIEDTLVVTDSGARSLTTSPRALQVL